MSPARSGLPPASSAPAPITPAAAPDDADRAPGAPLDSQSLLRGQRTIAIVHNGEVYRLQATRLGKLILTK